MRLMVAADTATEWQMSSRDLWGLIVVGVITVALWLLFRRLSPDGRNEGKK